MLYESPFITIYCCVLALILGACVGSFTGCLAWRTVHGESIWRGRSHCDVCGHSLGVRDLVPVVSYLAAGGRCRYCGAKLPARHVWGEAMSAAVYVALLLKYDISLQTLEWWLAAAILLACAFADLEGYIIPDRFIAAGIVLFIGTLFFSDRPLKRAADGAIGGFAVALGLLLFVLLMEKLLGREAMGGGDIKLLFLTGLFLGWQGNLLCLFVACLAGIVTGLVSARRRGGGEDAAGQEHRPIPWGPSSALGAFVAAMVSDQVWAWYLSLL